jgi:hypothetical protein
VLLLTVFDFELCPLSLLHKLFFLLLDFGQILLNLLLVLFKFQILLLLQFLDIHIQVLLSFHKAAQLILTLQFRCDEGLELLGGVCLDKAHFINQIDYLYSAKTI